MTCIPAHDETHVHRTHWSITLVSPVNLFTWVNQRQWCLESEEAKELSEDSFPLMQASPSPTCQDNTFRLKRTWLVVVSCMTWESRYANAHSYSAQPCFCKNLLTEKESMRLGENSHFLLWCEVWPQQTVAWHWNTETDGWNWWHG